MHDAPAGVQKPAANDETLVRTVTALPPKRTQLAGTIASSNRPRILTPATKKRGGRKYRKAAGKRVKSAMHRVKKGTLKSGPGGKGGTVKSRKQAIAIGLSEARKKGAKVPKKKS
jgi:hypothetical protein